MIPRYIPHQNKSQPRISSVAGAILVFVALLVGVSVFIIMQRQSKELLSNNLQISLQNRMQLAHNEIRAGFDRSVVIATRPLLIAQIQLASSGKDDGTAQATLHKAVKTFLPTGLTALALFDSEGRELAHAGSFSQKILLSVPLNLPGNVRLIWDGQFLLHTEADMLMDGQAVGKMVVETALPTLLNSFKDAANLGKSGELAMCAPMGSDMQCFPSTLLQDVLRRSQRTPKGIPLPMAYALAGETGSVTTRDYRNREVVAAYTPVSDLGLGLVLKLDSDELYAPVWHQLQYLIPLLGMVVLVALLLLRWLLTPLVRRLVSSEEEAHAMSASLRDSENRIRALLNNVDEGIASISETGIVELFNPGAERMFGYSASELIGKNISMLMPEPYRSSHDGYLKKYLQTGQAHIIGAGREVTAMRRDGSVFPMELRVSEFFLEGRRQFIGVMRDITERKETEAKVIRLANYDMLTDLPNRRLVQEMIHQTIELAHRSHSQFAVMFLDLDKFKAINDTLGHDIGDQLLKMVGTRLTNALRGEDTVGRQGGDEFIVLLAKLNAPEDSALVARKMLNILAAPFFINGQELHTSASIGIAIYPQDGGDVDTLLKSSDTAMYYAKEQGRNSYQFFAAAMNAAAKERLLLESSLHQALSRNELLLHFQPIVSMEDGNIVAAEALVRWQHPKLGMISPARFIPVAEDTGLIVPLGEWVLRQACTQLMQWRKQGIGLRRVVVNLSPRQFHQKNLVQNFSNVLRETGVDPHWLGLEITESMMMENPEVSIGILTELQALGIELSLDDFGTGYSSLGYLKRFPIDKLKIDQSFVRDITTDPDDRAMVAAIIVMAHQLNIRVVAEGVETEAQLDFLNEHGCDEYQGYFFSRPIPADELAAKFYSKICI